MLVTGGSGFLGQHLGARFRGRGLGVVRAAIDHDRCSRRERVIDEICSLASRRRSCISPIDVATAETIVDGSRNVAEAAAAVRRAPRARAHRRHLPWPTAALHGEYDTPFPITDYGVMKLEAERDGARASARARCCVRTSLLYGTGVRRSIQTDVEDAITGRSTIRFFTDEYRCPAHATDVAAAISALARPTRRSRGPLHVAGPEAVSRADLARRCLLAGWDSTSRDSSRQFAGARWNDPADRVVLDTTLAETYGHAPVAASRRDAHRIRLKCREQPACTRIQFG